MEIKNSAKPKTFRVDLRFLAFCVFTIPTRPSASRQKFYCLPCGRLYLIQRNVSARVVAVGCFSCWWFFFLVFCSAACVDGVCALVGAVCATRCCVRGCVLCARLGAVCAAGCCVRSRCVRRALCVRLALCSVFFLYDPALYRTIDCAQGFVSADYNCLVCAVSLSVFVC